MRPPQTFGKYLLLDRISVGGMAEVFKAKSFGVEGFQKIIAIKRILPSMAEDGSFIEMFIDEAKIAGQLSHANIGQIFELGKIGDCHFIAMEYIWGKDLLQIGNRFRKLKQAVPVPMACYVAAKVCEGLDYAHRKRDAQGRPLSIIHRDVSPQNILVTYEGEVKLIDFGIAKAAVRSSRTQHGILKGKFGYMSPEQVRGLPLDRRSDVFAIGTLLWECLTGERLFAGDSDFATLEKVRNGQAAPPSHKNRLVPADVDRIVLKALALDVMDRYQWANQMQADLQQVLTRLEPVFTAKQLASWMKEAFADDLERDRRELEAQKRLPPPPVSTDKEDATVVSPPSFGVQGFSDEGPTAIFGEISSTDLSFDPAISADSTGVRPEPATPLAIPTDVGLAMPMPLPAPATPLPVAPLPTAPTLPLRAPAPEATPALPLPVPRAAATPPPARPAPPRRPIALYVASGAIGLVVLVAGWAIGTRLRETEVPPSPGAVVATTLVVATTDGAEGEIWVDGARRGRVGGEPLTIEGLALGEHDVMCRRAGVGDVAQRVDVDGRGTKVVTCRFQSTPTGTLLLTVITPGATVLVDKQEISPDAAKEPLILEAGKPHEIQVLKQGHQPRAFAVTVDPGKVVEEKVELTPMPPPRQAAVRKPREPEAPPPEPEPVPAVAEAEQESPGYLVVSSTPWARVWVDGKDTGKTTPITERAKITVSAGKHTVTFVRGDQRFSYTVMVEPGQEYVLTKQLPVEE